MNTKNTRKSVQLLSKKHGWIVVLLTIAVFVAIVFTFSGCGGGSSSSLATTTPPGAQPTGIPGQPLLNTVLPAYASTTANLNTSWSVDGYCKDFYVSGVQKAGPNNTSPTLTITNTLTEGSNVFSALCKNAAGTPGPSKDYSIVLDTTAPTAPVLASAVTTSTNAASVTISIEKSLDWMVESRVNNGAWQQVLQRDAFTDANFDTKVVHDYVQSLVNGLNTIQLRATDRAGNIGTIYLPLSITSSATGGGTTNPAAPTCSIFANPSNPNINTSTGINWTTGGTGFTGIVINFGDGSGTYSSASSSGSTNKTYGVVGTYTASATVTGTGGSNTCSTTVTVVASGGGTGNGTYQITNTYSAPSQDSIAWGTPLVSSYLFSIRSSAKCVDQYALPDGNKTSFCISLTNMSYSFRSPNTTAYCASDNRIVVGDYLYNNGGDATSGRISVFNKPTEDSMFHVSHFDTTINADTRIACDRNGDLLITTGSSAPSVRKVSRLSGANIYATYTTGFSNPIGATYDSNNNVFVADAATCRITKLTSSMTYDSDANQTWDDTGCGTANGQFTTIRGIASNDEGKIFVLDCGRSDGCRVQLFKNDGTYESEFSVNSNASAITAAKSGVNTEVYVANRTNGFIYKYTPK